MGEYGYFLELGSNPMQVHPVVEVTNKTFTER